MEKILDCLTRGLDLEILSRGYGEEGRGVTVSYQAQSPVLAAVLPSNSPGVHTLWLPVIALQMGLVLKPGPQEPWTPYRIFAAFTEAGVPREAFALYPGEAEAGAAVLEACDRSMIFGGTPTVERYRGNPRVQAHGPGFSKIILGDDVVDRWEDYLDLMADSIYLNSGRGCINCSGVWASRHTREIADALAARLGPIEALPPTDPKAGLAAFTVPGMGAAVWKQIEQDLTTPGVTHSTAKYGPRLIEQERASYLRPTIIHAPSPDAPVAQKEYMFPFAAVVECPQAEMIKRIGPTLVGTVITDDAALREAAINATHIDRLNLGPVPTIRLNWLQPHEGNLIDFLYRNRALQVG
jgi:acyl-CoA reductase-like NAD-dependent aldehyde dehydrogenase